MRASFSGGWTLAELMVGMAIMLVACGAFASLTKYLYTHVTKASNTAYSQEDMRQALSLLERALVHANEIQASSNTFVEFVMDIDHSSSYAKGGDIDGDGIPNYRDADRDGDAQIIQPSTAAWRVGFSLEDDDEDGDGKRDVRRRLYWSSSTRELFLDMSVNEGTWGGARLKRIAVNVSTFSLAYFGNKANTLGKNIDCGSDGVCPTAGGGNNDGIIDATEMDKTDAANGGLGDKNGKLDTSAERSYITMVRVHLGLDRNKDGTAESTITTDIFPPLMPLKSR